jgi:transposase
VETTNVRKNEAKYCAIQTKQKHANLRRLRNEAYRGNVMRQNNNRKHQKTAKEATKNISNCH